METTLDRGIDVKAEFARRRKARNYAMLGLFVVLCVMLLVENLDIDRWLALALVSVDILALLAFAVYTFRVWRCPVCDKYLGAQSSSFGPLRQLTSCPKCKAELV
jgi:hypothetical protein